MPLTRTGLLSDLHHVLSSNRVRCTARRAPPQRRKEFELEGQERWGMEKLSHCLQFFFNSCTHGLWKFPSQGLNPQDLLTHCSGPGIT